MKTILVTGGAGFIGSHVVDFLIQQGMRVLNVDALTYAGNLENLRAVQNNPSYQFAHENICHKDDLTSLVRDFQPDAVMHLAAESHVDRSIACADDFVQTNIVGTHCLLDVTLDYFQKLPPPKQQAFRFLHISTDEVFGTLGGTGAFTETSPYQPNSPYAASKASSDLLVRSYFRTYGFPAIIANASNNYGPRQYPEKLIPLILTRALEGQPLPVYGDGQQRREWLYVTDHVRALWALLQKGRVGESYCIGAENERTNLSLVKNLCALLDDLKPQTQPYASLISFVEDRLGHDVRYAVDATKIRKETGWTPEVSFEEGLQQTVQWYVQESK